MPKTLLRIDASARRTGSVSRELTDRIIARFTDAGEVTVLSRDLADGVPLIDEAWVGANFTAADARTSEQAEKLAFSDTLISELDAADVVVIGVPIYNFGIPAALKAWIDLVCRARETFRYTDSGPQGLLQGRRAYLIVVSGGTSVGSEIDHATGYLRFLLGFIGITDVELVAADKLMSDPARTAAAEARIDALAGMRAA